MNCEGCIAWDKEGIQDPDEFLSSPSVFGLCRMFSLERLQGDEKHGLEVVAVAVCFGEGIEGEFLTRKDFHCKSYIDKQ